MRFTVVYTDTEKRDVTYNPVKFADTVLANPDRIAKTIITTPDGKQYITVLRSK